MPEQLEFSDLVATGRAPVTGKACLDFRLDLKRALVQDIKECRWSREQIADGMSKLLGYSVSRAQIDAIVAETHRQRLGAEWVPAWVQVTGSTRVLELVCLHSGLYLANEIDHNLAQIARMELTKKRLSRDIDALRKRLAGKV
jgi:hypothetical protein